MKETAISDIERINVIVLVVGSIVSLVVMRDFKYLFSFAVASAIMTLNFRILKKIIVGGIMADTVRKGDFLLKLPLKFLILAGLIAVVVIFGDIDVIFFFAGLSTVFASILINQIVCVFSSTARRRQKNGA
jgi:hypothetical protein